MHHRRRALEGADDRGRAEMHVPVAHWRGTVPMVSTKVNDRFGEITETGLLQLSRGIVERLGVTP